MNEWEWVCNLGCKIQKILTWTFRYNEWNVDKSLNHPNFAKTYKTHHKLHSLQTLVSETCRVHNVWVGKAYSSRDHQIPLCIQWQNGRKEGRWEKQQFLKSYWAYNYTSFSTFHPRCYPSETGFKAENNLRLNSFYPKKETILLWCK